VLLRWKNRVVKTVRESDSILIERVIAIPLNGALLQVYQYSPNSVYQIVKPSPSADQAWSPRVYEICYTYKSISAYRLSYC